MNCPDDDNVSFTNDDDSLMKKSVRTSGRKRAEKVLRKQESLNKKKPTSTCKNNFMSIYNFLLVSKGQGDRMLLKKLNIEKDCSSKKGKFTIFVVTYDSSQ